ncbi:MAG: DUF1326 domain-containing protein [Bryobacteraceae bacterium]
MRNSTLVLCAAVLILLYGSVQPEASGADADDWAMNATIIEACSCPMFCQCYFGTKPAAHGGHASHGEGQHFCKFNNAFRVNKGKHGTVSLDGAKFWVAGDLGGDFSQGQMDWAVLTFDSSVKKEQRDGIAAILSKLYPVKWNSFTVADDARMEWKHSKNGAVARLNGGKTAEVVLKNFKGMTNEPVVIRNLKYWGAPRNDGFVLMPNEVEAYRAGDKAYEFKGTNGFMITVDIASSDFK